MLFWLMACLQESSDPAQIEVMTIRTHDWDEDGFSESGRRLR